MDALTAEAYDQQYLAAIATNGTQTFGQNGFDTEDRLRDRFGTIWDRWVELRPGLELQLVKYTSCHTLSKWEHHAIESPLMASFRLLGQYCTLTPRLLGLEETIKSGGYHYLTYTPDVAQIEQWFADND